MATAIAKAVIMERRLFLHKFLHATLKKNLTITSEEPEGKSLLLLLVL